MRCYSEREGPKFQLCQKRLGYRTCFVQYNKGNLLTNISPESTNRLTELRVSLFISEGGIARRGCSTKMPMFHVECENHVSGIKSEKFCYCSYQLCNYQKRIRENLLLIATMSSLVIPLLSWPCTLHHLIWSLLLWLFCSKYYQF